jgi:hypothetical protein
VGASSLLGGLLLAGSATAPALIVYAERAEGERACMIEVQRRRLSSDALLAVARRWPGRRAIVVTGSDTPYRCVGEVVFTLQRAGFEAIEYRAGSPPRRAPRDVSR